MTQMTFDRGAICSVPSLGHDALCLLLSAPRGVKRGRPEFQAIPLYRELPYEPGASDAIIEAQETTLGVRLFAGLWNIRPILAADLGEWVGMVTREAVITDLRDAFLHLVDPSIRVMAGRVGVTEIRERAQEWRAAEIARWQPLTGRALCEDLPAKARPGQVFSAVVHFVGRDLADLWQEWSQIQIFESADTVGLESVLMHGHQRVLLHLPDVHSIVYYPARHPVRRLAELPSSEYDAIRRVMEIPSYAGRVGDFGNFDSPQFVGEGEWLT